MMPMPNFSRISSTESLSAMVSTIVAHVVEAQPVLRHDMPQRRWSCASQAAIRALEVGQVFLRGVDRGELVLHQDIDDAVRHLDRHRPDFLGRVDAEAAALDHRRPAHAERRAFGRDDDVASRRPARCCRRSVRPLTTAIIGTSPLSCEKVVKVVRVDRDARADVVLAGPAAAALAEQHQRQPEAVRQLEDPVLLVVVAVRPACRPAPCSRSAPARRATRVSSNRSPLIEHMPATTPSPGVFLRSASIVLRWCWRATTSGQYSLNEPGSTRRAMFSRGIRSPVLRRRATASGRFSSSVRAWRSMFSRRSSRM